MMGAWKFILLTTRCLKWVNARYLFRRCGKRFSRPTFVDLATPLRMKNGIGIMALVISMLWWCEGLRALS